jgi:hypothetical protein
VASVLEKAGKKKTTFLDLLYNFRPLAALPAAIRPQYTPKLLE